MPFVRILLLIVAVLVLGVVGFAVFRPDPEAPAHEAERAPPPVAQPIPASPRERREILSPADASSSAEITAREAAEAERRLEPERQEPAVATPSTAPVEMMPPDASRPIK